jgi:hypothetical protein
MDKSLMPSETLSGMQHGLNSTTPGIALLTQMTSRSERLATALL